MIKSALRHIAQSGASGFIRHDRGSSLSTPQRIALALSSPVFASAVATTIWGPRMRPGIMVALELAVVSSVSAQLGAPPGILSTVMMSFLLWPMVDTAQMSLGSALATVAVSLAFVFFGAGLRTKELWARVAHRRLRTQYAVMCLLAEGGALEALMPRLLETIAGQMDYELGIYWRVVASPTADLEHLEVAQSWARPGDGAAFVRASRAFRFQRGQTMVGEVWNSVRPRVVADFSLETSELRALIALERGLRGAFWIPILDGGKIRGVLEFVSRKPETATVRRERFNGASPSSGAGEMPVVRPPGALSTPVPFPTGDEPETLARTLFAQLREFLERRGAERATLLAQEDRRILLDSMPAMVWFKDADNRIIRCNRAAAASLGLSVEQVEGRLTSDFYPREAEKYHQDDLEVIRTERSKLGIVEPYEIEDGSKIWIRTDKIPYKDERGQTTGVVVFAVDVSDRVRAEEIQRFLSRASKELSSSLDHRATLEAAARLATSYMADFCIVDVLSTDMSIERLYVAAADGQLAEQAAALKGIEVRMGVEDGAVARTFRTGQPTVFNRVGPLSTEIPPISSDCPEAANIVRGLEVSSHLSVPINIRSLTYGVLTLVSTVSRRKYGPDDLALAMDLAHRSALALDNARLFERAQEAIRARQDLLASVSHELKNPLAAIELNVGMLSHFHSEGALEPLPPPLTRAIVKSVGMIHTSTQRMSRLISDLLDLAKIEAGTFSIRRERHDLGSIVTEAFEMALLFAREKNQRLIRSPLETDIEYFCDRERILQVLMNLIRNAVKFTPPGGTIRMKAGVRDSEVELTVEDTGPGIAAEQVGRIFDRFWQANEARHLGTGLGMSIARGIVEAHGGSIRVDSRLGEGSCFTVIIPRLVVSAAAGVPDSTLATVPLHSESLPGLLTAPARRSSDFGGIAGDPP